MVGVITMIGVVIMFMSMIGIVISLGRCRHYKANWDYYRSKSRSSGLTKNTQEHYIRREVYAKNRCIWFVLVTVIMFVLLASGGVFVLNT